MKDLLQVINYIYDKYPKVEELSKTRLVKLVYLIDWKYAINTGKQFTEIKWYFNHYGPYVEDVMTLIKSRSDIFSVNSYINSYGAMSDSIFQVQKLPIIMSDDVISAAEYIIQNTWKMNWTEFISLVYSTFPIQNNSKYSFLDLEHEAILFNQKKGLAQH